MFKNKLRLLGMSTLVGAGLLASGPASAYNMRLGGIDIQIDTIVSVGLEMRVEDRNMNLLPAANGGNPDLSPGLDLAMDVGAGSTYATLAADPDTDFGTALLLASGVQCATSFRAGSCQYDTNDGNYNYDTGINGDDGRLNFDNGDLTGGTLKFTSDIEATFSRDLKAFVRVQGFYDAVLDNDSSYERVAPTDRAKRDAIENINILDAYLDYTTEIAGNPLQLRAGRQVINWGESTYFAGGNSVFSPIDVPAIRRPGAEIKEALLPVEAIYGSLSLPYDLTLEAYVGGWDHFKLDVGGTPMATSDAANLGSGANGSSFLVGTDSFGGNRRNCAAAASATAATKALGGMLDTALGTCTSTDLESHVRALTVGKAEFERNQIELTSTAGSLGDANRMRRGVDLVNDDFDDYGIAVRWYAENLNSTEFGFYYQNYTSRVPYVSSRAGAPILGVGVIGPKDGAFTRQYGIAGCASQDWSKPGKADAVKFEDPLGLAAQYNAVAAQFLARSKAAFDANPLSADGALYGVMSNVAQRTSADVVAGVTPAFDLATPVVELAPTTIGDLAVSGCVLTLAQMGVSASLNAHYDACRAAFTDGGITSANVATATALGCNQKSDAQNKSIGKTGSAFNATDKGYYLPTGSITPALRYQGDIFLEYPDDIEVIGMSFNTTVLGWGVQGEVAYRPNMPLQHDTDMITISAIAGACTWEQFTGVKGLLYGQQLTSTQCGDYSVYSGYSEERVTTYDLGTTATFTRSNPFVNFLGADMAVLLTEFQVIDAPGIDKYKFDYKAAQVPTDSFSDSTQLVVSVLTNRAPRLASRCTSGSDLPLGGVLSIDPRDIAVCRPTEHSSGGLLYAQLQYNNVFGSPYSAKPTIVYSRGISGMSPSPAASWVEDQYTTGLSLEIEKQGGIKARLGYTMYEGDDLYNPNIDRDNVSLAVSYAY